MLINRLIKIPSPPQSFLFSSIHWSLCHLIILFLLIIFSYLGFEILENIGIIYSSAYPRVPGTMLETLSGDRECGEMWNALVYQLLFEIWAAARIWCILLLLPTLWYSASELHWMRKSKPTVMTAAFNSCPPWVVCVIHTHLCTHSCICAHLS